MMDGEMMQNMATYAVKDYVCELYENELQEGMNALLRDIRNAEETLRILKSLRKHASGKNRHFWESAFDKKILEIEAIIEMLTDLSQMLKAVNDEMVCKK